jgi:hypothetical protein
MGRCCDEHTRLSETPALFLSLDCRNPMIDGRSDDSFRADP